ncbi:cation efflux protein [Cutaneotrichosporon oleaginosum]|uniref:Cation efflux protein n=1 Tax=Cutaneotrichosporon oleaginosum TaxID=879819 RepID=A0A0J1B0W0_9TREE|nr:cation efflux protein [Cutaneotrichosporon oleaginosum]KLT41244.1 cation efflux protein [Cutaneotrichosporon oleaginosum]TXT05507.1 hypothetical protein COLE_06827 [Cutaneotrichosporon oleaginosum]
MRTPASRRIFGFLCLNLAYMGVQMGYGIATNSLGLISDAIHMLFDCLGIGVGLWASVAATWKSDGQYTFGYSRIETLSGFANGCFLILISVFIIFEAIQRVLNPPEMETRQLLLVSGIGLAINLFGMWATGGHHHHGHSHGHGHGHGHSHGHGHGHDHGHTNGNGHVHSIVHDKKTDIGGAHEHDACSNGHSHGHHEHGHGHDHKVDHGHDVNHGGQCDHAQANGNGLGHAHGHSHVHHAHHDHSHSHDHGHAHSHSHGHDAHAHSHSHSHEDHDHDPHHSHNMRGVFLHVMADTLGSVGVIVSTLLIRWTGWTGFDPLASLFIATLILASVFPLVLDAARVLVLDVGPYAEPTLRKALGDVATVRGVKSYSAARVWPREDANLVGSLHIQLAPGAEPEKVAARVEAAMRSRVPGLKELVLQIEDERFCTCMTS